MSGENSIIDEKELIKKVYTLIADDRDCIISKCSVHRKNGTCLCFNDTILSMGSSFLYRAIKEMLKEYQNKNPKKFPTGTIITEGEPGKQTIICT